ncbi:MULTISPECIES: WhiB family transcriptional regulator [unclassified Streptomyces]|uniref:WhiB family transcriptional regulator n=1 Tax=unclassified Streptomyces TaxID=2593676 RepID=UPI003811FC89
MSRPGRYWPDTRHNALPRPAHWSSRAACVGEDPRSFHPEGSETEVLHKTAYAKSVCRRCPVSGTCQIDALERAEPHGVWGGLDASERREILRRARARERARQQEAADASAPVPAAA